MYDSPQTCFGRTPSLFAEMMSDTELLVVDDHQHKYPRLCRIKANDDCIRIVDASTVRSKANLSTTSLGATYMARCPCGATRSE